MLQVQASDYRGLLFVSPEKHEGYERLSAIYSQFCAGTSYEIGLPPNHLA